MSVLIAYGTKDYATIMSDSRVSYYKDINRAEFVDHSENRQKIFKITDKFYIGAAGFGSVHSWIKDVKPDNPESSFYILRNYTYEQLLNFFIKRFKLSKNLKEQYCAILCIGIDSQNKIRMDILESPDFVTSTAFPSGDDLLSKIFLPPNIDKSFEQTFTDNLLFAVDKESYCNEVIHYIADHDSSVNKKIQKYTLHI